MSTNDLRSVHAIFPNDKIDLLELTVSDTFVDSVGNELRQGYTVNTPKGVGVILNLVWSQQSVQQPSALVNVNTIPRKFFTNLLTLVHK